MRNLNSVCCVIVVESHSTANMWQEKSDITGKRKDACVKDFDIQNVLAVPFAVTILNPQGELYRGRRSDRYSMLHNIQASRK
jgi:hypothetical protein